MLRLTLQRNIFLVLLGLALMSLGFFAVSALIVLAAFSGYPSTSLATTLRHAETGRMTAPLLLALLLTLLFVLYASHRLARNMVERLAGEIDEHDTQPLRAASLSSLDRSLAGIAHEVRNPLAAITLLLDELDDRLVAWPYDRDLVRRTLQEIERLKVLVDELPRRAVAPQKPQVAGDVTPVLRELLLLLEIQCRKGGVELATDLPANLPPIRMDAARLKQAVLNLLLNALEAMPHGGRLRVTAAAVADSVEVIIADSGAGIAAERLPRIFEPFSTGKGEGRGLGLAMAHSVVAEHDGRIEVESQIGVGTTFLLYFPAARSVCGRESADLSCVSLG